MADASAIQFKPGKKFGGWEVQKKIDEGGFGQVYVVVNKRTGVKAALKAESNEVEGGSAIKLEILVLRALNKDGEKPHVPVVYHAAKRKQYCYMIMTLLGDNFKKLKEGGRVELSTNRTIPRTGPSEGEDKNTIEVMSVSTWTRLGVQSLYALKVVHDNGFVHRDIKPNNFVMGHPSDPERSRLVYILDFGLSRSFAFKASSGRWISRLARGSAEFRGTVRYCSPNVHDKIEQGRRDDVWSWIYVLIELHCGLPWQGIRNKEEIEKMKLHIRDEHLMINMPRELRNVVPALRKLDCYHRPDYLSIYKALLDIMKRYKVSVDDPYDWEDPKKILKPSKRPAWHDAEEYFRSDPINLNGPPDKNEKEVSKEEKNLTVEKATTTKEE